MIYMKIFKKGGGSREKGEEETKSMPHALVNVNIKIVQNLVKIFQYYYFSFRIQIIIS
jgi:hypothetical protein